MTSRLNLKGLYIDQQDFDIMEAIMSTTPLEESQEFKITVNAPLEKDQEILSEEDN